MAVCQGTATLHVSSSHQISKQPEHAPYATLSGCVLTTQQLCMCSVVWSVVAGQLNIMCQGG